MSNQDSTKLPSVVTINDVVIEQIFYKGQPCVTFQMVADVHGIDINVPRMSFRNNRKHFIKDKHFYRLDFSEASQLCLEKIVSPNGLTLLTERGYLLLTKPMRDDVSWAIQERMIDEYFALRQAQSVIDMPRIIAMCLGKPRLDARRFAVQFYANVSRVYGKPIPKDHRHSPMMGGFIERYIYKALPTAVRQEMDRINPRVRNNRKYRLHQMLSVEMDTQFLMERMRLIDDLLDGCRDGDYRTFRYTVNNYDRRHCMQIALTGNQRLMLPVFEEAQLVLFEEKHLGGTQ